MTFFCKTRSVLMALSWTLLLSLSFANLTTAQPNERQLQLFTNNCLQCHASEASGAPLIGNTDHWEDVIDQGEDVILKHVVEGIRGMPPLGYCSACTENDFRQLIYLVTGMPAPAVIKASPFKTSPTKRDSL
jgi:cytochrome c5